MQVMVQADGTPLVLIHLAYRRGFEYERVGEVLQPKQAWAVACTPNLVSLHRTRENHGPWLRSDDARAVTCPNCKETPEYRKALARQPHVQRPSTVPDPGSVITPEQLSDPEELAKKLRRLIECRP